LPAAVWEEKVLSPRVTGYDPQLLDHLFLSGEAAWGRLRPPKRDEKDGEGLSAATRAVPISLMLREDLAWLVPEDRSTPGTLASQHARDLLSALNARGALFFQDLKALTGQTPQELEDALRELAAWGVVTSDTFTAVRAIVRGKKPLTRWESRFGKPMHGASAPIGRWSLFPGVMVPPDRDEMLQRWCRQLLARYGVIFRDVLARESAAPSWYQLVPMLRRMELRGEVRGGRFISGVAGEQYALESVVSQLRDLRDQPPDDSWAIISAGDPLNLSGIVTCGPRVAAMHKNSLVLHQGRCVAAKVAGRIEFHVDVDPRLQLEMRRALQHGRRITDEELEKTKVAAISGTPASRWTDRWKAKRRFG
jgi:ATP-dependent Lhr-like helicase